MQIAIAASLLVLIVKGIITKTGSLGIRIMYPNGAK
jgi:hypothetical protein